MKDSDGLMIALPDHGAYGLIVSAVSPGVRDALWFPFTEAFIGICGPIMLGTRAAIEDDTGVRWYSDP